VALNVFAAGKQYHVFFVYAKQSTKQTYQIWVGPGFDKDKHFELTNVRRRSGRQQAMTARAS
jgi:hypothetical protein